MHPNYIVFRDVFEIFWNGKIVLVLILSLNPKTLVVWW